MRLDMPVFLGSWPPSSSLGTRAAYFADPDPYAGRISFLLRKNGKKRTFDLDLEDLDLEGFFVELDETAGDAEGILAARGVEGEIEETSLPPTTESAATPFAPDLITQVFFYWSALALFAAVEDSNVPLSSQILSQDQEPHRTSFPQTPPRSRTGCSEVRGPYSPSSIHERCWTSSIQDERCSKSGRRSSGEKRVREGRNRTRRRGRDGRIEERGRPGRTRCARESRRGSCSSCKRVKDLARTRGEKGASMAKRTFALERAATAERRVRESPFITSQQC